VINELRDRTLNGCRNGHAGALLTAAESSAAEPVPHRYVERYAELDLTIFVACYNEEANILATLETLAEALRELPLSHEIIVIDDASRDRSVELVKEYQAQNPAVPVRLVENPGNRGLARNFVEGAFLGRGRYYKLVCGDNVEPRENLLAVFKRLGNADLVVPYHERTEGRTLGRRLLSRTYTTLVNFASGYSLRYYNGCGLYRRADVMRWHSRAAGFGFQADLVVRLLDEGASHVEVPIVGHERPNGSSSALKFRNWLSVARTLLAILFRRRK
jgi:glycosyltransferase involved in cell wall biosynthesis